MLMALDLLLAFEPLRHLRQLVLVIGRAVGILGKVDVQALRELRVVVVGGAVEFNRAPVVVERMQFRKVEVVAYP